MGARIFKLFTVWICSRFALARKSAKPIKHTSDLPNNSASNRFRRHGPRFSVSDLVYRSACLTHVQHSSSVCREMRRSRLSSESDSASCGYVKTFNTLGTGTFHSNPFTNLFVSVSLRTYPDEGAGLTLAPKRIPLKSV